MCNPVLFFLRSGLGAAEECSPLNRALWWAHCEALWWAHCEARQLGLCPAHKLQTCVLAHSSSGM